MARNFQKMTKEELSLIIEDGDLNELNSADLNQLRNAAKQAGILSVQFDNILGLAINNRTYEDIKNSKDYTDEEKAVALEARNEYNRELRLTMKNKHYNAEEILSRAVVQNGKYFFPGELTKGEMDFLTESGALRKSDFGNSEDYKVGQEKESNLDSIKKAIAQDAEKRELLARLLPSLAANAAKREAAAAEKNEVKETKPQTPAMPADLQKSYDFWNKFNEKSAQSGVKFNIENLSNKSLLVEAEKNGKTMFKGIDHGSKGFDIVKRDKSVEPYEIFDLLVKKAKTSNPKTKIRIKDNVKDDVMRNKILIACAKNNMIPVGNLPEGFDFEELKALVKDAKTTEEINDLAYSLYQPGEFEIDAGRIEDNSEVRVDDMRMFGTQNDNAGHEQAAPSHNGGNSGNSNGADNNNRRRSSTVIAVPVVTGNSNNGNGGNNLPTGNAGNGGNNPPAPPANSGNNNGHNNRGTSTIAAVPVMTRNGNNGNGGNNPPAPPAGNGNNSNAEVKKPVVAPKRPFWKKVRDAAVIAGIGLLSLIGVRSCQNQERLERNVKDLKEQVDKKSLADCEGLSAVRADAYASGYNDGKKDCEDSKKPKAPVRKTTPKKKTTPVKPAPVYLPGDTIKGETVYIPGDTIKQPDIIIPGKIIQEPDQVIPAKKEPVAPKVKPSGIPLEEVDTSIKHEKDYDLNEALELDNQGKTTGKKQDVAQTNKGKTLDLTGDKFNTLWQVTQNQKIH